LLKITSGVEQGCGMTWLLFLIAFNSMMQGETEGQGNGIIWNFTTTLEYLDFCHDKVPKKYKTCTVFLSSYRDTSGSLGEREMLGEQELQTSVSTAFSNSPELSRGQLTS